MRKNLLYAAVLSVALAGCSQNDTKEKTYETQNRGTAFVGTKSIKVGENPLSRTSLDYDRTARTLTY